MTQSEQINELSTAMVAFQAAVKNPTKNRTVTVRGTTKAGKAFNYDFKYSTYDEILDTIRDPLSGAGLAFMQEVGSGEAGLTLTTTLLHSSGQWKGSTANIPMGQDRTPQAVGAAITYFKRYTLTATLGIAADEDDDANAAEGNQVEVKGNGSQNGNGRNAPKVDDEDAATVWTGNYLVQLSECLSGGDIDALGTKYATNLSGIEKNRADLQKRITEAVVVRRQELKTLEDEMDAQAAKEAAA